MERYDPVSWLGAATVQDWQSSPRAATMTLLHYDTMPGGAIGVDVFNRRWGSAAGPGQETSGHHEGSVSFVGLHRANNQAIRARGT